MAFRTTPTELTVPAKATTVAKYLRDYLLQNKNADVQEGTLVRARANVLADQLAPMLANAQTLYRARSILFQRGAALDESAKANGTSRLPDRGASGYVTIAASAGGATIAAGTEGKCNGLRYVCTRTSFYLNGQPVPVRAVDTGRQTNQLAGSAFRWTSPPFGVGRDAVVTKQPNGTGLVGGAPAESDGALLARLLLRIANPPASGNDAAYWAAVLNTPGLPIQAAFTYPSIGGPGTIGIVFLMVPAGPGASRAPTDDMIRQVLGQLQPGGQPVDDVPLVGFVLESPTTVALSVTWAPGASGWADAQPWPLYSSPMVCVDDTFHAPTPTSVDVIHVVTAPVAGQTIGFFDKTLDASGTPVAVFRRKKIATVASYGGPPAGYTLTFDTTYNASDTSYTPLAGQPCCPWSDSLDLLAPPVLAYFDALGPGEQRATLFDMGLRWKRSPAGPLFPSEITNRMLGGPPSIVFPDDPDADPTPTLFSLPALSNVRLTEPSDPWATPVGNAGVSSVVLTCWALVAFPI